MTVLINARLPLLTLKDLHTFEVCEHENGTGAQNIKLLDGVLKQSIQFKDTVLSVGQEVRCLVWAF